MKPRRDLRDAGCNRIEVGRPDSPNSGSRIRSPNGGEASLADAGEGSTVRRASYRVTSKTKAGAGPLPECADLNVVRYRHNAEAMRACRRRSAVGGAILWAAVSLGCALLVSGASHPVHAAEETGYRGRRLVDVLQELRGRGLELIFSSAVVGAELRITVEPVSSAPRAVLDEILLPLQLKAEDGPGGSLLIVPASPADGILRGRIVSVGRGRPIVGATVRLPDTGVGATSDVDGRFEIRQLRNGTYTVIVEARGFSTAEFKQVRVTSDTALTVELRARPAFVTEVVVTPNRHSVVREEQASRHTVTQEEAVLAPTIGGDVSRVVELLPGVTAADGSAAFNARGSVAQDVSMVLDGMELYDPFHLQSFHSPFSLIDSNIVDRIDFFGGGFTADLGDRHGGFVEISTLVPEDLEQSEIEIGTLNSRISHRAPGSRGGAPWLVSARAWYPEAFHDTTELGSGEDLDPRFGDVYAKFAFQPSPRHRLSAHGLLAYDRLTYTETDEEVNESVDALTRNGYVWLRSLSAWSPSLTSETVLSAGRIERIRDGVSAEDGAIIVDDDRFVDLIAVKHDATWQISNAHVLKTGADIRWLRAEYRYSNEVTEDPSSSSTIHTDPDGTSLGVYAAHRVRISPQLATEVGARWDRQTYTNDNQLSPRFNVVWRPGQRSELRLGLGRFSQSQRIHELRVEDGETRFRRAEIAEQAELSFEHGLRGGSRIRVDAYYRELSKLRPRYENLFEPVELFPETTLDRVLVEPEEARLRGVELLLRSDANRPLFWWVSYALSSAEDVIDGRDTPRSWDQRHAGKFLLGYRRDERWSVSLIGSIHTGWPTTPVTAESTTLPDGSTEFEVVPGERNSDRFAHYARLDLKARRSVRLAHGRLWLTLEVVNLTDRDNPCCIDDFLFDPQADGTVNVTRQFDHWLGTATSFSVLWEF